MSSQKTNNNDSCRDLSGRRLSTIKEANKLADYLAAEPARKKAAADAQKAKLEALEKRLGIDSKPDRSGSASASGSSTPGPSAAQDVEAVAGKKHRFDDNEYLEQSQELVENVKSAVSLALLKKRKNKKPKLTHEPAADATPAEVPVTTAPVVSSVVQDVGA
jgi:hypothetical protein